MAIISDKRADPGCPFGPCDASETARLSIWVVGDMGGTIARDLGRSQDRIGEMPVLIRRIPRGAPGASSNMDTTYWTFAPSAPDRLYQVVSQIRGPDAATLAKVVEGIVASVR